MFAEVLDKRKATEEVHHNQPGVAVKMEQVTADKFHGVGSQVVLFHRGLLGIVFLVFLTSLTISAPLAHL